MKIAFFNFIAFFIAVLGVVSSFFASSAFRSASTSKASDKVVVDASHQSIPAKSYTRIASLSVVADEILAELCPPENVIAVTEYNKEQGPNKKRWAQKIALRSIRDVEALIELEADLIVTHQVGDPRYLQRLREQGLVVFDLGEVRGLDALVEDIRVLSELLQAKPQADALLHKLHARVNTLRVQSSSASRIPGIYLSTFGKILYGGTRNTSYADLMALAGVEDIAAKRYKDWPAYSVDEILVLDPPWIVGSIGAQERLCNYPGLQRIQACRHAERIIELEHAWISSAGISLVEGAERLRMKIAEARRAATQPDPES